MEKQFDVLVKGTYKHQGITIEVVQYSLAKIDWVLGQDWETLKIRPVESLSY